MESNSDKQMRDKLTGAEFPFDPAAWDKMEAMLDKKKKRRFFFWWWTGGIAAALLLGVVAYELTVGGNREIRNQESVNTVGRSGTEYEGQVARENTVHSPRSTVGNNVTSGEGQVARNGNQEIGKSGNPLGGSQMAGGNNENTGSSQQSTANKKGKLKNAEDTGKHSIAQNRKAKRKTSSSSNNAKPGDGFVAFNGAGGNKNTTGKRSHTSTVNKQQANENLTATGEPIGNQQPVTTTAGTNGKGATAIQQETHALAAAGTATTVEEPVNLNRMEASLLTYVSENAITGEDKKEEDLLPKVKQRVFRYQLGVLANVTGTTIGKEEDYEGQLFYSKPSYMVGFTHDFLFVNRVALTNSILYSQTSFEVNRPKAEHYNQAPLKYNSQLSELTIPIGIKVYPVAKSNFKFYISAGITNHIKLKETFDYTVDSANYNLGTALDPNSTFYPGTNSFEGNIKTMDAVSGLVKEVTTDDFSINKSKRYYASFYAGAGVEYIAKKRFILFAEPVFYMGLQKIGVQDKRKYNFGVTGGFRYQF